MVPGKTIYLANVPDSWVPVANVPDDYAARDVFNRSGEKLGTIKDLLRGPDGQMAAAVIAVARALGIGDKDIAVPFSALQLEQLASGRRLILDTTREGLRSAPPSSGAKADRSCPRCLPSLHYCLWRATSPSSRRRPCCLLLARAPSHGGHDAFRWRTAAARGWIATPTPVPRLEVVSPR